MRKKSEQFRRGPVSESRKSSGERNWFDRRLVDIGKEISDGAPASCISRSVAAIRLEIIDRALQLRSQMDEARSLEAIGDSSGRAKMRSMRLALDDESRFASLLDRSLKGLSRDANLDTRCRLEEIAKLSTPTAEKSEEQVRRELEVSIFTMILEKGQIFPIPVPPEVRAAAAAMGFKLAIDAHEKF
jgi:hypothetical protein